MLDFKVGDLVRRKYQAEKVGVVLVIPEFFGFLEKCCVLWSNNEKEWCLVENLKKIDNTAKIKRLKNENSPSRSDDD